MYFKYIFPLFLILAGCVGERTSIQTGEVGKVLSSEGLENEIHQPGSFRLDHCGNYEACPKLVRLQVNKATADLTIQQIFLPKSNVDIQNVQVGLQFRVKADKKSINAVFEEVRPVSASDVQSGESDRVLLITAEMVYETFLKRKAADAIVTALRSHSVDEILTNVPEIAENTKSKINEMLGDTPIEVTEVGFPNGIGEVPEEVISAKRRLFAINEEKAREIAALEANLAVEEQRQKVQVVRVQNDHRAAVLAGVDFQTYKTLQIFDRFADAAEAGVPVALGAPFPFTKVKE